MSRNNWSKIFRAINKGRISWSFIDSVEFYHPELSTPMVYSSKMFSEHFTPSTVIDLTQVDQNKIKFVINKEKVKNYVDSTVAAYLQFPSLTE